MIIVIILERSLLLDGIELLLGESPPLIGGSAVGFVSSQEFLSVNISGRVIILYSCLKFVGFGEQIEHRSSPGT